MRSGLGAVDGAASVGTYTSILYFIFGVLNEVQFLIPFFLLFSRFSCFPDFFHARQTSFQNFVYDSAKSTATIAHVYGVGYCCFCLFMYNVPIVIDSLRESIESDMDMKRVYSI